MNYNTLSPHDLVRLSQQRLSQNAHMRGTATVDHAHGNCGCGSCAAEANRAAMTADAARPIINDFATTTAVQRGINARSREVWGRGGPGSTPLAPPVVTAPALPAGFTADARGVAYQDRPPTPAEMSARGRAFWANVDRAA